MTPLDIKMQRTIPNHVENQIVLDRQRNALWIKGQHIGMEIGSVHKFTEHELIQDKYLRNVRPYDN